MLIKEKRTSRQNAGKCVLQLIKRVNIYAIYERRHNSSVQTGELMMDVVNEGEVLPFSLISGGDVIS